MDLGQQGISASRPRVAIVVPVFNPGAFLVETLASIRSQTHPCELVLVDDGSTDSVTRDILASEESGGERVLRRDNGGSAAARNTGIRATRATYILPVDADDLIEPTYVEQAVAVMESSPDVGVVYCRADRFGDAHGPWALPPYSAAAMAVDNVVFATGMFRRSDWELVGGYDESLRLGGEDWDFWLSLIERGRKVVQLRDTLFHYRIHGDARSFKRHEVAELYATVFRKHERFFVEHLDAVYEHRFAMQDELDRLRRVEARASRLGRVLPPVSAWLRR